MTKIGTREDWLAARAPLLAREKEHTRLADEIAQQRRELPWVALEKEYRFDTEAGTRTLAEVFDGAVEDGLRHRADVLVSRLSHGEQRELELAVALATKPQLLLLDEPMAGLGVTESARMVALLKELRKEVTIVLVEHDMEAVFALADRITVLVYGRVIASGDPAAIRSNEGLAESSGISAYRHTMHAMVVACGLAGVAGATVVPKRTVTGATKPAPVTMTVVSGGPLAGESCVMSGRTDTFSEALV